MAGHNLFILSPALSNADATLTARAYLRYRANDDAPGTETDMGVDMTSALGAFFISKEWLRIKP